MARDKKEPGDVERDIRACQSYSLAGAIGRAGAGTLQGASPVPELVQAVNEIETFVNRRTQDLSGALKAVLRQAVRANEVVVERHGAVPLDALHEIVRPILENDVLLVDFVRRVDAEYGRMTDERPHFQKPGQTPHPEDEYTHESVRRALVALLGEVDQELSG